MKKNAFTLVEILLAMAVIGIIAGAVANSLKGINANKVKLAFQNNYIHMLKTIETIRTDETIMPATYKEDTDEQGKQIRNSFCEASISLNEDGFATENPLLFPASFTDLTGGVMNKTTIVNRGFAFSTKNGSYWMVIKRNGACNNSEATNIDNADYWIVFDTNGLENGANCPYNLSNSTLTPTNCDQPDTFRFGLTRNNNILDDTRNVYYGSNLTNYIKTKKFIESDT